jgi:hypothetical protein
MGVNIKATFKKDDRELNGLEHIVKELIDDPLKRRIVIGIIEVSRVTTDYEDGSTQTPTVRFLQIEALEGDAAERGRMMLSEASQARTGRDVEDTLFDGEPGEGDPADE